MPTFGEIADEVGGVQLSDLHESSDPEPDPQPVDTSQCTASGYVVRRFVGHRSEGLVTPKPVSQEKATQIAARFNADRKPGDPQARIHQI